MDYDDHELGRELTAANARIASLEEANAALNARLEAHEELHRIRRRAFMLAVDHMERVATELGMDLDPYLADDYEALGYPETSYGYQVEVDSVRVVPDVVHRWLHSLADNPTDKE